VQGLQALLWDGELLADPHVPHASSQRHRPLLHVQLTTSSSSESRRPVGTRRRHASAWPLLLLLLLRVALQALLPLHALDDDLDVVALRQDRQHMWDCCVGCPCSTLQVGEGLPGHLATTPPAPDTTSLPSTQHHLLVHHTDCAGKLDLLLGEHGV